jgi:molybdate transport system substrate-binding protein
MLRRRALSALFTPLLAPQAADAAAPVAIFAATSLTEALRAIVTGPEIAAPAPRLVFAASSTLARQIEQGAPADLFLSADEHWMDYLATRGLAVPGTRISPIGNALVMIAPADAAQPIALAPGVDLLARLGPQGRLAMGDPSHVPAGRYAEAALSWLGQWPAITPRLARAENVRAALMLVERGEAPLGIVYATDALAARGVRVIATFPAESHPPITYPFALMHRAAANAAARGLLDMLAGPVAAPVWMRHGFVPAR